MRPRVAIYTNPYRPTKRWKDLNFDRPDKQTAFTHIDPLFSDMIDWDLIKTHLPDMLRVALRLGAHEVLYKPIAQELLLETVRRVCQTTGKETLVAGI